MIFAANLLLVCCVIVLSGLLLHVSARWREMVCDMADTIERQSDLMVEMSGIIGELMTAQPVTPEVAQRIARLSQALKADTADMKARRA